MSLGSLLLVSKYFLIAIRDWTSRPRVPLRLPSSPLIPSLPIFFKFNLLKLRLINFVMYLFSIALLACSNTLFLSFINSLKLFITTLLTKELEHSSAISLSKDLLLVNNKNS